MNQRLSPLRAPAALLLRGTARRVGLACLVVLLLGAAVVVGGVARSRAVAAQGSDAADDHAGGRLALAVGADPPSWSPAGVRWDPSAMQVGRAIYDRLAVYDENNQLLPELAESFEPNATFTEWAITLRPGITFSDGTPLDAEVLRRNVEAQRSSAFAGPILRPVRSVFVTGPLTVNVTMTSPWSTFPELFTTQAGFIASPATLATPEGGAAPIGTGPFRMTAWNRGTSATLDRNPSYWQPDQPLLDGVDVWFLADPVVRSGALLDGQVDVVLSDEPPQSAALVAAAAKSQLTVLTDPQGEMPKLTFVLNTASTPFLDPVARRAVVQATDREAMVAAGYDGLLRAARGMITDESAWFNDRAPIPRDVEKAKADAARYAQTFGRPLTFTLLITPDPVEMRFAALWQAQLAQAGIVVTIDVADAATVDAASATGAFDAVLRPMFGEWHPDLAYPQLHQSEMTNLGAPGPNFNRFGTRAIDTAFDSARRTSDFAKQVDAYRTMQNEVLESQAYLFLLRLPQVVAAGPQVHDLTKWTTASGNSGLETEGGTVSLDKVWLREPDARSD